eukprot:maker-scaffold81_size397536-snap-gene-1.16 protein:Tk08531 transcript:maker-scaffold81_size397536-snap-gene-1.16-mRNA-1 annotation:"hypothetical protein CB1_000765096"
MPVLLGPFETSLRGGDSPNVDRKFLHKGCCGTLHGHGVRKERAPAKIPAGRSCSLEHHESSSSGDESAFLSNVPDILSSSIRNRIVNNRSHSSDCATPSVPDPGDKSGNGPGVGVPVSKRSNSASVAQRLFTSPTLATTAKVRAERTASDSQRMTSEIKRLNGLHQTARPSNSMYNLTHGRRGRLPRLDDGEHDSGHFSSDNEGHHHLGKRPASARSVPTQIVDIVEEIVPSLEDRKQLLINGVSEDELLASPIELRQQERLQRRGYVQRHGSGRKESPSPGPKPYGDRGRRSSDESSSISPPVTPTPKSHSAGPRSASSSIGKRSPTHGHYAFGSSTSRFASEDRNGTLSRRPKPYTKSHSDDMSTPQSGRNHPEIQRTASDSRSSERKCAKSRQDKKNIAQAWMQFRDDVECALQRKPNQVGFYKDLTDMMHSKMEVLNDEERNDSEFRALEVLILAKIQYNDGQDSARSEEQLANEKAFLDAEKVWLVHKDGFAGAGLLKGTQEDTPEGKVRVQLEYNGDIIEVEEDDVEKANPSDFDKVEDLAQLRYLNESSALHTLRQRYGNSLIHTFAGPTIISINPMAPLAIYTEKAWTTQ